MESLRNIEQKTQISFEPFSANILQRVNEARGIKEKNAIFESVMNDDRAMIINNVDGNAIPYGNIMLQNKYGRMVELTMKEIRTGIYRKKITGFL